GSKPGGLTSQPWILRPSCEDLYQISSTAPRARSPSRPSLRPVMRRGLSVPGWTTATSAGCAGRVGVDATVPFSATEHAPLAYGRLSVTPPTFAATALNRPSSPAYPILVLP